MVRPVLPNVRTLKAFRIPLLVFAVVAMVVSAGSVASAAPDPPNVTVLSRTTIKNYVYGQCLSSNFAGSVYAVACSGSDYHKWERLSDGQVRNYGTRLCLSANYEDVYTTACSSSEFHEWDRLGPYPTFNNAYTLLNLALVKDLSMNATDVFWANPNYTTETHYWYFTPAPI